MDLAFLFVGQAHAQDFEALTKHAKLQFSGLTRDRPIRLISILGGGVIGENVELDQPERPSMSLLIGSIPDGAEIEIVNYSNAESDDEYGNNKILKDMDEKFKSCLIFTDPWFPVESVLTQESTSNRVVAGGISCPLLADQSSLAIDNKCLPQGSCMVIGFAGTLKLQTIVAQGCRPVSASMYKITKCDGNVILKLDGKPALEVLKKVAEEAPPEEQELIQTGLLCGLAKSNHNNNGNNDDDDDEKQPLDFLSRQLMGFVPQVGGIAISTTQIEENDYFCFQVRDGTTAEQDLELMVQRAKMARLFATENVSNSASSSSSSNKPVAAFQISCIARGRGMFDGVPNVDISNVKELVGNTGDSGDDFSSRPVVGGFFANGEIGPVGLSGFSSSSSSSTMDLDDNRTYLHSFTTVAAILCQTDQELSGRSSAAADGSGIQVDIDAWG